MERAIKKAFAEGKFVERALKKIDMGLGVLARNILYKFGKIKQNKLFVMTYDNSFTCNPSYIVEELLQRNEDIEIVWAVSSYSTAVKESFPEEIKLVKRGSFEMFEEMASSKIWLDNALNCVWYYMPKKRKQVYINTWHGSMGIKRLKGNKQWMFRARQCKRKTDYCISNSVFEDQVYRGTFWPHTPILRYGHARNDLFFDHQKIEIAKRKVRECFELQENQKIFMYAPTFRDDGDTSCYTMDYAKVKESLEKRFGGDWVVFVRAHFKNREKKQETEYNDWLKDASEYPDMQELMVVADAGSTDYSSWAYDYILTKRPLFIYAADLEKYDQGRGFYYPLSTTPFPIAQNNEEMQKVIEEFDDLKYKKQCEEFLKDKGCAEQGTASRKVADLILNLMKSEVKDSSQS